MKKDFSPTSLPTKAPITTEQWYELLASLPADVLAIVAAEVAILSEVVA